MGYERDRKESKRGFKMITMEMAVKMMNEDELFSFVHEIKSRMEEKKLLQIDNPILDSEIKEICDEMKDGVENSIYSGQNDEVTHLKDEFIHQLQELGNWQEQDELISSFLNSCEGLGLGTYRKEEVDCHNCGKGDCPNCTLEECEHAFSDENNDGNSKCRLCGEEE